MEDERTKDSVEQIEGEEMKNPITDEEQELTEPGAGFEPGLRDPDDPEAEGPPTGGRSPSPL